MPALASASVVRHTACLRPVAPDGLPIIGRAPGWDNVYLATGGGKKGILLSPGIGEAIADLITAGETPLPIGAYAPGRFAPATA
jgi:glycine/D-amino acid oxidase-like deaminating enzyme